MTKPYRMRGEDKNLFNNSLLNMKTHLLLHSESAHMMKQNTTIALFFNFLSFAFRKNLKSGVRFRYQKFLRVLI